MVLEYLWRKSYIIIYVIFEKVYRYIYYKFNFNSDLNIIELCNKLKHSEIQIGDDIIKNFLCLNNLFISDLKILVLEFEKLYVSKKIIDLELVENVILKIYKYHENSPQNLYKLYQLSIIFGLYTIACKIRIRVADLYIKKSFNIHRILAKIEKKLSLTRNEHIYLNYVRPSLNTFVKKRFPDDSKIISDSDKNFYHLIHNKRIVILGPLFKDNVDVSKFDVVVFIKKQNIQTLSRFNKLTQVFYFNSSNILNGSFESFYSSNKSNSFYCLKSFESEFSINKNVRKFNKNDTLLSGGPMMLQNILYDMLFFSPDEIYITGFNFYQTKIFYNDNYTSSNWYDDLLFKRTSFSSHDLFANFLFVKNLLRNNLISTDKELKSILNLTPTQYFESLQCH